MSCDEFENQILAHQENQLSAAVRAAGAKHLADCAGCQSAVRQLQQLDAALTIKLKAPALSTDFKQRLSKRIQAGAPVLSEAQRTERKRQLQADYEIGLAQLHRRSLSPGTLLNGLGYVAVVALVGWLAWLMISQSTLVSAATGWLPASQRMLLLIGGGALPVGFGLMLTYLQQNQRRWAWFRPAGGNVASGA